MNNLHNFSKLPLTLSFSPMTRTAIARFAGAGGDFNPIHLDDEYAKSLGFPSVFAMGMLTAGLGSKLLDDTYGIGNVREYKIRFKSPVWPNDQLTAHASELSPRLNSEQMGSFLITDQAGEVKLTGTFSLHDTYPSAIPNPREIVQKGRKFVIGGKLEQIEFPIEHGKVREFKKAISCLKAKHAPADFVGHGDNTEISVPSTFTSISPLYSEAGEAASLIQSLNLNASRVLHTCQAWKIFRSPKIGETLQVTRLIEDVHTKPSKIGDDLFISLLSKFVDSIGNLVVEERMQMIERS